MKLKVDFDELTGTLYVIDVSHKGEFSYHPPNDTGIILHGNLLRSVVGMTLIGADQVAKDEWQDHPDRKHIPSDFLDAIDKWFNDRESTCQ